jgi:hypothetical protein
VICIRRDARAVSSPSLGPHRNRASEDLLVDPLQERNIELHQFLPGYVGEDRPALAFIHQVPHCRDSGLAATLVCNLSVIGNEVKLTASVTEATLLDFVAAHEELAGMDAVKCNSAQPPPSTI